MQERIKAIKEYLKYYPNDSQARERLSVCEYATELGIEVEFNEYGSCYPYKMEYGKFKVNEQISAVKRYSLTNSTTKYVQNGEDTLIMWSASCGRLDFVSEKYWYKIEDEWQAFINIIKSYEPLDWDSINNCYIFSLRQGQKLITDYKSILEDFKKTISARIKAVKIEEKKRQIELLQKELAEY